MRCEAGYIIFRAYPSMLQTCHGMHVVCYGVLALLTLLLFAGAPENSGEQTMTPMTPESSLQVPQIPFPIIPNPSSCPALFTRKPIP